MHHVLALRKRTVAVVAGGAFLFLAGFMHGYCASDSDAGWHAVPAEH